MMIILKGNHTKQSAPKGSNPYGFKRIFKYFLPLFIPLAVFEFAIAFYIYYIEVTRNEEIHAAKDIFYIQQSKLSIKLEIDTIISDLLVVSQHRELASAANKSNVIETDGLSRELMVFSQEKGLYDQVRFIDYRGMERVRINYIGGKSVVVPQNELQDKKNRYYFYDSIRLNRGEVFVSPLDLNIENGKIELPYKPTIRFATPVYNSYGKKIGVVVLNYLASRLIDNFVRSMAGSEGHSMIVNADSYWLRSNDSEQEWGFMLNHRRKFKDKFPKVWEQISGSGSGQLYSSDGLFTFDSINPLEDSKNHARRTVDASTSDLNDKAATGYYWKIVAWVPDKAVKSRNWMAARKVVFASALLFLLTVLGSWLIALAWTRRLEVEVKQKESEEKYRTLFEASNDAIMILNKDMFIDCNQSTLQMFGFESRDQFIGKHPGDISPPRQENGVDSSVVANQRVMDAYNNEKIIFEWLHCRVDGRIFNAEVLLTPMVLGGQRVLQAIVRDISERKRVENELARFKSTLDKALDCVFMFDPETLMFFYVNQGAINQVGYGFNELMQMRPYDIKPEYDESMFRSVIDPLIKGPMHAITFETIHQHKDGRLIPVEIFLQYLAPEGEIPRFVAFARDLTERQKINRQLRHAQKMEAIGQLTGGIAHDFNNMLTAINGYTEMANKEAAQYDNKLIIRYLDHVKKSGKRAQDLVAQMLAFSRGGEIELKPIMVVPLIKESVERIASTSLPNINIEYHMDDVNLIAMTNQILLHQMLMNLCVNAGDAMDGKGNIIIGCSRECGVAQICSSCQASFSGDYIKIDVTDTGGGISSAQLERVFDPFFTTKEVGKGTGMGLSIVHGVMHDHGGHILVKSLPGKGTTISLLFPDVK